MSDSLPEVSQQPTSTKSQTFSGEINSTSEGRQSCEPVSLNNILTSEHYSCNTLNTISEESLCPRNGYHLKIGDHDLTDLDNKKKLISDETINLKDTSISNETTADLDEFGLLGEHIPIYKLRAKEASASTENNWIEAPLYFDEQAIRDLTYEQIQTTLDYFILSGNRVSQMTKTYYDIEAVTRLLDEKEKDLELAATIGKQLLEKDQQLEEKIEYLELEIERTTEMVNQLRYDISIKDNLLKTFLDCESDNSYLNDTYSKEVPVSSKLKSDLTINEYKNKIQDLEEENEQLKSKYEFLEREATDLDTKESVLIENCFRELDESNYNLQVAEQTLEEKNTICSSQQQEIQDLFSQIFELQLTIKNLTKENTNLQSGYSASITDLVEQINDLKEKYNECLKVLSRTQEELLSVRKRYPNKQRASTSNKHLSNVVHLLNSTCTQAIESSNLICDDDDFISTNGSENPLSLLNTSRTHLPSNSNSLATEVFCSLARDFRAKHNNLSHQANQSSDFIKKVKQKLTKQIPGSSNYDSCLQTSDSEMELITTNTSNQFRSSQSHSTGLLKNFSCHTPDSTFSTGSGSVYSNLLNKSNSFLLPEKLQIVKPIEGSQTLQHWQHLARPNLGCLFETRPGISVKRASPENNRSKATFLVDGDTSIHFDYDDDSDAGVNDMYEDEFSGEYSEFDINQTNSELLSNFDYERSEYEYGNLEDSRQNYKNVNRDGLRLLSPSRVEILTNLLKQEEMKEPLIVFTREEVKAKENNFFFELLNKCFNKTNINNQQKSTNRQNYDDPDTPPSSPINLPGPNVLYDAIKSTLVEPISNYFQLTKSNALVLAPTPPGTPQNELDEIYLNSTNTEIDKDENRNKFNSEKNHLTNTIEASKNFFEQLVDKLSLFSFKAVAPIPNKSTNGIPSNSSVVFKPVAVYNNRSPTKNSEFDETKTEVKITPNIIQNKTENCFKFLNHEEILKSVRSLEKDLEQEEIEPELLVNQKQTKCETPPPSPSKFSPPLPQEEAYDEEDFKKSAFVRVASLNPLINKSIDLNSLLGSLSSLKKNQRSCKY